MSRSLAGKVALVTGASTGIGEGIAYLLGELGVRAVLVARRHLELQRVAQRVTALGAQPHILAGDLNDDEFVTTLVPEIERKVGAVDILVNNAGVANLQPTHELTADLLDEEIRVNFRTPALLSAAVLPHMRQQGWGRIINVASEAGVTALAGMAAYSSTKRALIALSEVVQEENRDYGIKVWALCPGMVDTPGGDDRGIGQRNLFLSVTDIVETVRGLLQVDDNVMLGPQIRIRTQQNVWQTVKPLDWSQNLKTPTRGT